VIIQRYQDYTGKQATLEADKRSFQDVAYERRNEAASFEQVKTARGRHRMNKPSIQRRVGALERIVALTEIDGIAQRIQEGEAPARVNRRS